MTRLISFNVNGIRARQHQLEALKEELDPDIVGLQEIKVHDEQFPMDDVASLGYEVEHFGQKSHYGVALLSKLKPKSVQKSWPWDEDGAQRRLIAASYEINGKTLHVINGYFPQGESQDHPTKFPAKRAFYADLLRYLNEHHNPDDLLAVMGDMNISPEDIDIGIGEPNRKRWLKTGKCSFLPEEREWYQKLFDWGLSDTYRSQNPDSTELYSWFDYRSKGFNDEPKRGLRIDHILVSAPLLSMLKDTGISYEIRGMEKPSDHAPIYADFDIR